MESFYVQVHSDSSREHFGDNKITNFKTWLNSPISVEPDAYEVALLDLTYYENKKLFKKGEVLYTYTYLPKTVKTKSSKDIATIHGLVDKAVYSPHDVHKGGVSFVDLESIIKLLSDDIVTIDLSDDLNLAVPVSGPTISPFVANTEIGGCRLFVYCDIVENEAVGDTAAPLLRGFIRQHEHYKQKYIEKEFVIPQYKSLCKNFIQYIWIYVLNEFGQPPPFEQGALSATLHFRRKR